MAVQSGKDKFSKDDIIEILKRNVSLYKDEKEFVDYIVNLAMYLMDQYYDRDPEEGIDQNSDSGKREVGQGPPQVGGGHKEQNSPPLPRMPMMNKPRKSPPQPPASQPYRSSRNEPGGYHPPSAKELQARAFAQEGEIDPMEEFLQSAPPRPFGKREEKKPEEERVRRPVFENDPVPHPKAESQKIDEELDQPAEGEKRRRHDRGNIQVDAKPLATPDPTGGLSFTEKRSGGREGQNKEEGDDKKFDVVDKGKTRVYRVVRPFRSSTSMEVPCTVCGAMVPGESTRCPTCGHIV